jgi:hypothetical protein
MVYKLVIKGSPNVILYLLISIDIIYRNYGPNG